MPLDFGCLVWEIYVSDFASGLVGRGAQITCPKIGRVQCTNGKTLGNLISAINPALGEAYKRDRWHSGATGKRHNIGAPRSIIGIGTSGNRLARSNDLLFLPTG